MCAHGRPDVVPQRRDSWKKYLLNPTSVIAARDGVNIGHLVPYLNPIGSIRGIPSVHYHNK